MESKAHPAISSLSLAFDIGLLGRTAAFLDATGLCNLEACARFVQGAFHATSSNPEAAPFFRSFFFWSGFQPKLKVLQLLLSALQKPGYVMFPSSLEHRRFRKRQKVSF